MKGKIKNVLCGVISLAVVTAFCPKTFAMSHMEKNSSSNDIVDAKVRMEEKYKSNYVAMTKEESEKRDELIDREILKLTAYSADKSKIDNILNKYKVYRLDIPQKENKQPVIMATEGGDIALNKPTIYYDSAKREWVVSGGGNWRNGNWKNDATPIQHVTCPSSFDIGGYDSIGVSLHNIRGSYGSTSLVRSECYVSNGYTGGYKYLENLVNNNYEYGFGHDYQDYITDPHPLDGNDRDWRYMGVYFSAVARYSSSFAKYHGNATTYYSHTWDSITYGVSFSNSGVSIGFSSGVSGFKTYSADTSF